MYIIISLLEALHERRLLEQFEDLNVFHQLIINNSSPARLILSRGAAVRKGMNRLRCKAADICGPLALWCSCCFNSSMWWEVF